MNAPSGPAIARLDLIDDQPWRVQMLGKQNAVRWLIWMYRGLAKTRQEKERRKETKQ
jgi:hypothetical protein